RRLQGEPGFVEEYRALVSMFPERAFQSIIAATACDLGQLDEARAILGELSGDPSLTARRDVIWAIACVLLAEVCDVLDAAPEAEQLSVALTIYAPYWMPFAEGAPLGPTTHALGLLARARDRLDEAVDYFERAIADARRVEALPFLARALVEQAATLERR